MSFIFVSAITDLSIRDPIEHCANSREGPCKVIVRPCPCEQTDTSSGWIAARFPNTPVISDADYDRLHQADQPSPSADFGDLLSPRIFLGTMPRAWLGPSVPPIHIPDTPLV